MDMHMALKPRLTEKTYALSESRNVYVFDVPKDAQKLTVASAVASQFKVTVTAVNIANIQGKAKRSIRKGGRAVAGRDTATKKAYVTLKQGDHIPVFAAVEEAKAKSDKLEKASEKAAAKTAKKDNK